MRVMTLIADAVSAAISTEPPGQRADLIADSVIFGRYETPKGSCTKYRYDSSCHCFELATTLPEGMTFRFEFGFIPSTSGDDGDPLDVLIFIDSPVIAGCVVRCR